MNDHACKDFCQQISKTQKAEQAMTIRHAKFISVMADGGTDVASLEEEIVYVRLRVIWSSKNVLCGTEGG